jgi:uncharacterized membrane protein
MAKTKGRIFLEQISRWTEKRVTGVLLGAVIMNLVIFILLAWGGLPVDAFTLRFAGGFFLLIFVCLHGWYRYGWNRMVIFFAMTLVITWTAESLSIATGIPFGKFYYTEILGEKIGNVPIMIIPAYFFNGYLAWTMGNLFVGNKGKGIQKKNVVLVPLVSALIMVLWNVCLDPVMSTIEGNWVWQGGGAYHGVPISNFFGWLVTVYLVFQAFALFLLKAGDQGQIAIRRSHWYLFPAMYVVQGLPFVLYPFFRADHADIYRAIALVTVLTMFFAAAFNLIVINRRLVAEDL